MTVQVHTAGPGVEDYRSTKFQATVDATTAYVYGYTRSTQFACSVWAAGASVEQSWLGFGADESASVAITLASGDPITAAVVYPKDAGVVQVIAAGVLTLTVPINVRLRVEVNGDRSEVLSLFSSPLKPTLSTDNTLWTDEVKTVSAIGSDANAYLTVTAHGWGTAGTYFRCIMDSSATLPKPVTGSIEANEAVIAIVVDADTVQLLTPSLVLLTWATVGTGTITLAKAIWTDTVNTLHFDAGVHVISRLFEVASNCTIYMDEGAVVIGSFNLKNVEGVTITGPGCIGALYTTPEVVHALSLADKYVYSVFWSDANSGVEEDNTLQGVTIFGMPFYANYAGLRRVQNVQLVSPWNYSTDGWSLRAFYSVTPSVLTSEVVDCYALVGDDAIKIRNRYRPLAVSGSFVSTTNNGCFQHPTNPTHIDPGFWATVTDCHALTLCGADTPGGGSGNIGSKMVFKAITDGFAEDTLFGQFRFAVQGLKIWGPVACRMFLIGNMSNPFPGFSGTADLYGQCENFVLQDIWCEEVPAQMSVIVGRDANNNPHDIAFDRLQIGGVDIVASNASTYVETNEFVFNLTWATVVSGTSTFTVEDGSGVAGADTYCTVAFADTYHVQRSNPAAWTALSTQGKENALREATFYLQRKYGRSWYGYQRTAAQGLAWPRSSVTDTDTGFAVGSDEIPVKLQRAVSAVALRVANGVDLSPDIAAAADNVGSSSFSVGGISVNDTYIGVQNSAPRFPEVAAEIRGLLSSTPGGIVQRVSR